MIRLPESYLVQERKKGVILPDALPVEGAFAEDLEVECEEMAYRDDQNLRREPDESMPQPEQELRKSKKHFWRKLLLRLAVVVLLLGVVTGGVLLSY